MILQMNSKEFERPFVHIKTRAGIDAHDNLLV